MGEGFEHVVLTGGIVQVTGQGASLQEAFAQAALGVFALIGQRADSDHEMREVRAHGQSPCDLLLNWIAECLYVHELEAFIPSRIEFASFPERPDAGGEALRLHAFLHGEPIEADARQSDPPAPTGPARVEQNPDGFDAVVTLRPGAAQ